jgi:hypothetical protein
MRVLLVLVAVWVIVLGCAVALAGYGATVAPPGHSEDRHDLPYAEVANGGEAAP